MDRDADIPTTELELHDATTKENVFYNVQFTEDNIRKTCKFSGFRDQLKKEYSISVFDPKR